MFFKLQVSAYKSNAYNPSSTNAGSYSRLHDGAMTIYVSTDEIKRVGFNQSTMQYWVDFKSPPVPWMSETLFTGDSGAFDNHSLSALINYIEGTETFT